MQTFSWHTIENAYHLIKYFVPPLNALLCYFILFCFVFLLLFVSFDCSNDQIEHIIAKYSSVSETTCDGVGIICKCSKERMFVCVWVCCYCLCFLSPSLSFYHNSSYARQLYALIVFIIVISGNNALRASSMCLHFGLFSTKKIMN